jgi:polysaccharide deacetylase 2 family uncharacterized protein YibQ
MPRDELRQPLRRRSPGERLWAKRPGTLAFASFLTLAVFGGGSFWLSRIPHPMAGEPVLTLAIPPVAPLATASTTAATDETADTASDDAQESAETDPTPFSQPDSQPTDDQPEATLYIAPPRPLKPAPFAAYSEESPDGPLPKLALNGKAPADAYAQVTPINAMSVDQPKIALMLGGMGLNTKLTQKAIKQLPGEVTFGFAPYGQNLQAQVNQARARGHEVMLQLPMEPTNYPANNPGPNTLLADAPQGENLKALRWNMSRFAGYTGIVNYMGSRFLSTGESLKPMFAEMKKRGLIFLEDGSVGASEAEAVASMTGLRTHQAETVIDANPDSASIKAALADLEQRAKSSGLAVGTGTGLDVTIDEVAQWSKDLAARGIILVPVSAMYNGHMG